MKQKYQATGSRFLVRRLEEASTTAMGIIIKSTDQTPRAVIVSMGPRVSVAAEVGDVIVVDWSRVGHVDGDVYVVAEENVLAVVG